jgi:hypothetical protein
VEVLEDETLQVIHHSFTEFLCGENRNDTQADSSSTFPVIDSKQAHKRLAIHCVKYLQSGSLVREDEHSNGEELDYLQARLLHPFLSYAVENWSYHASNFDAHDRDFFTAVNEFFDSGPVFRRWVTLQWQSTSRATESTEAMPTALHVAAFAGLSKAASRLIQDGLSISSIDGLERTPLRWAATNGPAKVASLLIEHGCDPNAEDEYGVKPIHLAARKNHASVVRLLLEAGVEPGNIKTKENIGRGCTRLKGG